MINLAEWLHNITLGDNRRCESNHITLGCCLKSFFIALVKFLMTMLNFSKEMRKKHGDSCDQGAVIIFHLKLINESPFNFGLSSSFIEGGTPATLLQSTTRWH